MKNRGSSFNQQEDERLCRVYLEISQDPIVSNNQALKQLMCTILYSVRNLKSCVIQVENMHLSGASEHDIMEKAKNLLVQDPKLKKGFKFDHVWILMKDIPKFSDNVNVGIPNNEGETIGSPTSQSPGLSSFSINLSSDDGGSNSSQHPIGSKKAKLKRKLDE
uniref:No apical meristem-associated C-terminal domain-containing protein n=1 Tax=Brassica oleracea var. oleracea TaxID=109376 RepID=A0A0D3CFN1_BRAOL